MPSPGPPRSTAYIKRGAGGIKMAVKMAMVLLASCASPASANEVTVVIDPPTSGEEAGPPPPDGMYPRILTVLTTYNERTPYIKAYREAIETRTDGYEPVIFVTSDEEDVDPDGVIDYKFGEPAKHRLLRALTEAYARYEGQYDWVAVGDDDTVFMYNRARAFLKDIDHTQPVAIGRVDGIRPTGRPGRDLHCYSPEQKANTSDALAPRSCCKDFTRPCEVPIAGDHLQILDYGPGGLFWPYGGTGVFLSAGVMERVADGRGVEGWTNCSVEFDHGSTDCQLGICMSGRGLSFSSYSNGFFESDTADPSELQDYLASHCQVLGIHLGLRHLADGTEYTPQKFRDAAAAVRDEDERCKEADFEKEMCPEALAALSVWK